MVLENAHEAIGAKAHLTGMVSPGMLDIYHGWPDQDVNKMITRDFDPISGLPPYQSGFCQIRRA